MIKYQRTNSTEMSVGTLIEILSICDPNDIVVLLGCNSEVYSDIYAVKEGYVTKKDELYLSDEDITEDIEVDAVVVIQG